MSKWILILVGFGAFEIADAEVLNLAPSLAITSRWQMVLDGYIWLDVLWWLVALRTWYQIDRVGVILFDTSIIEIQYLLVGLLALMGITIAFQLFTQILEVLLSMIYSSMSWFFGMMLNMFINAENQDWTFLQLIIYIICLLVGYELIASQVMFAQAAKVQAVQEAETFEETTYFFTGMMIVGALSILGLIQLATYICGCWRALKTIFRARSQEPEAEPVAFADADADADDTNNTEGRGPLVGILDDTGGGSSATSSTDGLRLRPQGQRTKRKLVGVTDVNTIRQGERVRIHVKKLHAVGNCRGLLQSQSPLVGILEVDISDAGLCRLCHRG